ncbi:hypothetical protein WA026_020945 [Henosepilachna vigintioctopunctata]|uniref:Zinc transporter ZIP3 n=1 Tax=Henosepilachna vigintioctopunctata TaxID=420089 RepID=A0AAW1UPG5_9CUCU
MKMTSLVKQLNMQVLESKILACTTIGVGSIFVGLLPICFTNNRNQNSLLLSCALCFGGGVLFSTSLIHMLPENREKLQEYSKFAEIIFCIGFFLLYIIDEIVHFCCGGTQDHSILNQTNSNGLRRSHHSHDRIYGATENTVLWNKNDQPPYNPNFYKTKSDSVLFFEQSPPSQLCHVGHQEPCGTSTPTINIGLVIALTIHSLLEGMVVGLENTSYKVILLLGAISSHKLVVGFCLGLELSSTTTICRHIIGIIVFACGSVGGIALGAFVSNVQTGFATSLMAVLQGLTGGTLLYVTLSEIVPRERARWHQQHEKRSAGLRQFISLYSDSLQ